MTTVNSIHADDHGSNDGSVSIYTWSPLTTTNTDGAAIGAIQFADRSVQVSGTFGAGGSLSIQGSNDGSNWFTLNNAQGTAATFTSAGLKQVVELPRYIRPFVSAGDGTTSLTVVMVARRQNPLRT